MDHASNAPTADRPPLRIALIGFGAAGQVFHAPLITATPDLRLAAVVTGDPERQAQVAAVYPDAVVFDSADGLLAAADSFDGAVIATPNRTHHPLALATLAAGLPTVVDKPLATSVDEANELVDASGRVGVSLTVFQNRRWDSAVLMARQLVETGQLGRVYRFEARHERWRPTLKGGWRELGDPGEGGGLLYDIGAHLIDQALLLLGPVTEVYAELDVRRAGASADDDTFVALRHASGARSHLTMTVVSARPDSGIRLLGDLGSYSQDGLDRQEDALRAGLRPGSAEWDRAIESRPGYLTIGDETEVVTPAMGSHLEFYRQLAAHLRGAGPVPVDPRGAVDVLDVVRAAGRAARLARPVGLAEA